MSAPLSLRNVSVRLSERAVLNDVSFEIKSGEIVAILGPNGAGKTTLLRASLGLVAAQGDVELAGSAPQTLSARDRALRAAYLPQRPQSIWPVSVEDLVALGRFAYGVAPDRLREQDQRAVDEAIDACALQKLRTRRMDEISGGEKARAHLARALAQHAPLLLLDEPTAGLDPAQSLAVADILKRYAADRAVVLSTHDIGLALNVADRVVVMKAGSIIASGSPIETLTPAVLQAAYDRAARIEQIGDEAVVLFER